MLFRSAFYDAGFSIIHLMGRTQYSELSKAAYMMEKDVRGYVQKLTLPYYEKMDLLYSLSSLVFCRAGATTVAELFYFDKPAVLIPYPYAKDNHQVDNAESVVSAGQGILIEESSLTIDKVMQGIKKLFSTNHIKKKKKQCTKRHCRLY